MQEIFENQIGKYLIDVFHLEHGDELIFSKDKDHCVEGAIIFIPRKYMNEKN